VLLAIVELCRVESCDVLWPWWHRKRCLYAAVQSIPAQQVRIARLPTPEQCVTDLDELGSCGFHLS
jgi:hypothetical protein